MHCILCVRRRRVIEADLQTVAATDGNLLDWETVVNPGSLDADGVLLESPATPVAQRKSKITDYVAIQQGKLNGQEAFMTGRVRVEGDLGFLMQVVAITG